MIDLRSREHRETDRRIEEGLAEINRQRREQGLPDMTIPTIEKTDPRAHMSPREREQDRRNCTLFWLFVAFCVIGPLCMMGGH